MKRALVIIPSYNTGAALTSTVQDVLAHWAGPVWVMIDGSSDGSDRLMEQHCGSDARLRILHQEQNRGKGAAVLSAAGIAHAEGFTHACVFDADGQHCAGDITRMVDAAVADGSNFVAGTPVFGPEAPLARVKGRRVGNTFARVETLFSGPLDSLFGMRVYPLDALLELMHRSCGGRRYDFDTEVVVRMTWKGIRPVDFPTPVRYLTKEEGGVSHFKYLRDNVLLTAMHTRLLIQMPLYIPSLILNARRWKQLRCAAQESRCA